jgi:hypothetical protein
MIIEVKLTRDQISDVADVSAQLLSDNNFKARGARRRRRRSLFRGRRHPHACTCTQRS